MKLDKRFRRENDTTSISRLRDGDSSFRYGDISITAVALTIAAAVILVIGVMIGLGSRPFLY